MKNKLSFIILNEKTQYNKLFKLTKFSLYTLILIAITIIATISIFAFNLFYDLEEKQQPPLFSEQIISSIEAFSFSSNIVAPLKEGIITNAPDNEHMGIDIACKQGAPVRSLLDGIIILANELLDYGNTIIIKHNDNYYSKYSHLENITIKEHQTIKAGDLIGYAGQSGELADGPHLHFEIWQNNVIIDPRTIIKDYYKDVSNEK